MAGPGGTFSKVRSSDVWKMQFWNHLLSTKYTNWELSNLCNIKGFDARIIAQNVLHISHSRTQSLLDGSPFLGWEKIFKF